jgi:hypothetical protein
MPKTEWRKGTPLSESLQERLRLLVREHGAGGTAKILRLALPTVARAASGDGMREGTKLLIQMRLDKLGGVAEAA